MCAVGLLEVLASPFFNTAASTVEFKHGELPFRIQSIVGLEVSIAL